MGVNSSKTPESVKILALFVLPGSYIVFCLFVFYYISPWSKIAPAFFQLQLQVLERFIYNLTIWKAAQYLKCIFSLRLWDPQDTFPDNSPSALWSSSPLICRQACQCQQIRITVQLKHGGAVSGGKSALARITWWIQWRQLWAANVSPTSCLLQVSAEQVGVQVPWATEQLGAWRIFIIHKKWSISDIWKALQPLMRWGKRSVPRWPPPRCIYLNVWSSDCTPLSVPRVHYTLENVKIL